MESTARRTKAPLSAAQSAMALDGKPVIVVPDATELDIYAKHTAPTGRSNAGLKNRLRSNMTWQGSHTVPWTYMSDPTEVDTTSGNPWDWGFGPNAKIAASSLLKGIVHAAICLGWVFVLGLKKLQQLLQRS